MRIVVGPMAQELRCGMQIHDSVILAGTPWELGAESMGVHLCAGSWRDMESLEREYFTRLKLHLITQKNCL